MVKWRLPNIYLISYASKRPHVYGLGVRKFEKDFWGGVVESSDWFVSARKAWTSEIPYFENIMRNEDILRFYVSVADFLIVDILYAYQNLFKNLLREEVGNIDLCRVVPDCRYCMPCINWGNYWIFLFYLVISSTFFLDDLMGKQNSTFHIFHQKIKILIVIKGAVALHKVRMA